MIKSNYDPEIGSNQAAAARGQKRSVLEKYDNERLVSSEDAGVAYRTPYEILRAIRDAGEISATEVFALAPESRAYDGDDIVRRSLVRLIQAKKIMKVVGEHESDGIPIVSYRAVG